MEGFLKYLSNADESFAKVFDIYYCCFLKTVSLSFTSPSFSLATSSAYSSVSIYFFREKADYKDFALEIHGRHDPVIVPRAVVVVESMAAITLADALFVNMSSQMDKVRDFYRK